VRESLGTLFNTQHAAQVGFLVVAIAVPVYQNDLDRSPKILG
jgi:hypothetical protein